MFPAMFPIQFPIGTGDPWDVPDSPPRSRRGLPGRPQKTELPCDREPGPYGLDVVVTHLLTAARTTSTVSTVSLTDIT